MATDTQRMIDDAYRATGRKPPAVGDVLEFMDLGERRIITATVIALSDGTGFYTLAAAPDGAPVYRVAWHDLHWPGLRPR